VSFFLVISSGSSFPRFTCGNYYLPVCGRKFSIPVSCNVLAMDVGKSGSKRWRVSLVPSSITIVSPTTKLSEVEYFPDYR